MWPGEMVTEVVSSGEVLGAFPKYSQREVECKLERRRGGLQNLCWQDGEALYEDRRDTGRTGLERNREFLSYPRPPLATP